MYDFESVTAHLIEQRCDGVVAAVEDQQHGRNFRLPEVKQLVLLCDDLLMEERECVSHSDKQT